MSGSISSAYENKNLLFFIFPLWTKTVFPTNVFQVVGIEMNASAVSDARRNAEINDIKNCRFVCAKVRIWVAIYIKFSNAPLDLLENTIHP